MANRASPRFWSHYAALPEQGRLAADLAFSQFKQNPHQPSLRFKRVGSKRGKSLWSVRVGLGWRALAVEIDDGLLWIWIGRHDEYERLIRQ